MAPVDAGSSPVFLTMYNHFIKPFAISKALKRKYYYLKITKFNKIFLKLFYNLGLLQNYGHTLGRKITVTFLRSDCSLLYNSFRSYKKHAMKFIFKKRALNFFSKNTKTILLISNDSGYSFNDHHNKKGGKAVMIIGR